MSPCQLKGNRLGPADGEGKTTEGTSTQEQTEKSSENSAAAKWSEPKLLWQGGDSRSSKKGGFDSERGVLEKKEAKEEGIKREEIEKGGTSVESAQLYK